MKYTPYSFSKLSTHKQCPKKFKYQYIDKAPKNPTDMTALIKGGAIHSIIEHYPNKSPHKHANKYKDVADNFINSELGQYFLNRKSINEMSFGLTKELQPCEYNDKNALFRGYIDYITRENDFLWLIDWKTGTSRDEKWQSYDQLMSYAIYFFQRYKNLQKIKISYVYVEHNTDNSIMLDRKYMDNYTNQILTLISNAENDTKFEKNETKLCDWCDFQEYCSKDF